MTSSDELTRVADRHAAPQTVKDADFVQSLARGLLVIRSFDEEHADQTLSDVARRTGLTRATARRLLLTLTDLGYVSAKGRDFSLTPAVLHLGYAYLAALGVGGIAQPYLQDLSEQVHESASMTVLDGSDIVYVARVPTHRIFSVALAIGSRLPAWVTSMGRVLLADLPRDEVDAILDVSDVRALTPKTITEPEAIHQELDRAREQGWYLLDEELERGLRSVAAPIRDRSGRVTAAINVSTPAPRLSVEKVIAEVVPHLVRTADQLSRAMQAR